MLEIFLTIIGICIGIQIVGMVIANMFGLLMAFIEILLFVIWSVIKLPLYCYQKLIGRQVSFFGPLFAHRSTTKSYRSIKNIRRSTYHGADVISNNGSKWKTVWQKQHKNGYISTFWIHKQVIAAWNRFIDLFREKNEK